MKLEWIPDVMERRPAMIVVTFTERVSHRLCDAENCGPNLHKVGAYALEGTLYLAFMCTRCFRVTLTPARAEDETGQ